MSTPSAKLRRKRKRKGAVIATSTAPLDDLSSRAASRSSDGAAKDVTTSSNCNDVISVNEKRDAEAGVATPIVDNLSAVIPVAAPELEVVETYLGNLIDRLLMDAASDGAVMPRSVSNLGMPVRASRPRS